MMRELPKIKEINKYLNEFMLKFKETDHIINTIDINKTPCDIFVYENIIEYEFELTLDDVNSGYVDLRENNAFENHLIALMDKIYSKFKIIVGDGKDKDYYMQIFQSQNEIDSGIEAFKVSISINSDSQYNRKFVIKSPKILFKKKI